jgi:hypothetical protein
MCTQKQRKPAALTSQALDAFAAIVVFDFYDGYEGGVAIGHGGAAMHFSALGDSRSASFRAYEFAAIEGDWRERVLGLPGIAAFPPAERICHPRTESEILAALKRDTARSRPRAYQLGIGHPYLEWLLLESVTAAEAGAIRGAHAFADVHRVFKARGRFGGGGKARSIGT